MGGFFAALVAGAVTVLAFAPFGFYPFAIIGPAVLFYLWLDAPPGRSLLLGWGFGLGLFGCGVSWTYVSVHVYGHMPAPLAALTIFLLVSGLALFPAVVGWLQAWFRVSGPVRLVLLTPAVWTLVEWCRGWILTGFPWLSLGFGQVESPLSGLAPYLGVFGVSWASAASSGALVTVLAAGGLGARLGSAAGIALVWAVAWQAGQFFSWVQPSGEAIKIAVVQGNVPLARKWDPTTREDILGMYLDLSREHPDRDLVVWPEAALPFFMDQLPPTFWGELKDHDADFVIGILEREAEGGNTYNSVVTVADERTMYRKQHLVPFGEYLPLPQVFGWIIDNLQIPMSDLDPWRDPQPTVAVAGTRAAITICYEDIFGEEVRRSLGEATLMINVAEDSWFGDSLAPHQRMDMARTRALETGRPMVRAGNSGISAVIDHNGRITAETRQFIRTVLSAEVQPMQGTTPYMRFGTWPILALCGLLILVSLTRVRGNR